MANRASISLSISIDETTVPTAVGPFNLSLQSTEGNGQEWTAHETITDKISASGTSTPSSTLDAVRGLLVVNRGGADGADNGSIIRLLVGENIFADLRPGMFAFIPNDTRSIEIVNGDSSNAVIVQYTFFGYNS